jgi:hypothetical protein
MDVEKNFTSTEDREPKRSLEATILRLKLHYLGHIMTAKGSLERDIMLGQGEVYRRQGRAWIRWIDSIKEATSLHLETLKETVQDRKKWRMLVEKRLEIGNSQM